MTQRPEGLDLEALRELDRAHFRVAVIGKFNAFDDDDEPITGFGADVTGKADFSAIGPMLGEGLAHPAILLAAPDLLSYALSLEERVRAFERDLYT